MDYLNNYKIVAWDATWVITVWIISDMLMVSLCKTPTRSGFKVLIDICNKYSDKYCVHFNSDNGRSLTLEV